MKKSKTKGYDIVRTVKDNMGKMHTVFVYGEVTESYPKDIVGDAKVIFLPDGNLAINSTSANLVAYKHRLRSFNMGYAICQSDDVFDKETAIKLAKRRFTLVPMTAINARYLNDDMVMAILTNEIKYICEHFDKFTNSNLHVVEDVKPVGEETKTFKTGDVVTFKNDGERTTWYGAIKNILPNGACSFYWVYSLSENAFGYGEGLYMSSDTISPKEMVRCNVSEAREIVSRINERFGVNWDLQKKGFKR